MTSARQRPCGCPDNRRGYEVLEPSTEPHEAGCAQSHGAGRQWFAEIMREMADYQIGFAGQNGDFAASLAARLVTKLGLTADVPGPDDSTPEPAADGERGDAEQPKRTGFDPFRAGQFRVRIDGDWVTGNFTMAHYHHQQRHPVERLDIAWSPWWPGKPDPVPSLDDPQANPWATPEPPPAGEGDPPDVGTEANASQPESAGPEFKPEPRNLNSPDVDPVQGAGRDWRGEIAPEAVARLFHETYERLAPDFGYRTREASAKPWDDVPEQNRALMIATAGEIVAALGLHDLEQAAEHNRLRMIRRDGVPVMISKADVEHMQRTIETLRVQRDRAEDQRDEARQDLFAARRELEQLRGEVGKIAGWLNVRANDLDRAPGVESAREAMVYRSYAKNLQALADTTPATQDGASS